MIIHSYENSARLDACIDYIRKTNCDKYVDRVYLLPIPSTRDNKTVSGTNIYISDVLDLVDGESVIICYGLPEEYKILLSDTERRCFDISEDEEFLKKNAKLTAECTVGIILTTSCRALSDMRIGIVGYGRIGKQLARMLLYLGSKIRVYTSSPFTLLELAELGIETSVSDGDADFSDIDILINTAPKRIFDTAQAINSLSNIRVIDLASGDNFPALPSVEKYPSIPAKMFPKTAGKIWGMAIEKYITGEKPEKGG